MFAKIAIAGDVTVVVPDSLHLITPYVLREQEDWFEAETHFVRQLVQPGMSIIDIGANFGVYSLPMALQTGSRGHLWTFEPASLAANCLASSIDLNGLSNVTLVRAALSNRAGTGALQINNNSELNSLTGDSTGVSEQVLLKTLDECRQEFEWSDIDFVKMDAEGEESNILRGGETFLAEESPLVMFELKAGNTLNLPLIRQFADLGFQSYRLVPVFNALVPFELNPLDLNQGVDSFQLNLFCCKADRAAKLSASGLLIQDPRRCEPPRQAPGALVSSFLKGRPFAQSIWGTQDWSANAAHGTSTADSYLSAFALYLVSLAEEQSLELRYSALIKSFEILKGLVGESQSVPRLCTFARVAADLGWRRVAVETLQRIIGLLQRPPVPRLDEPFLPVCRRFEEIDPGTNLQNWLFAATLEAVEIQRAFSSYYTGPGAHDLLQFHRNLGFPSPQMERRRQLVRMRYGMQPAPEPSPLLAVRSAENRNPEYWNGVANQNETLHGQK